MRLSDLHNAQVRTLDGDLIGHVHEVHCNEGRVVAIMCGPGSIIERLTARKKGRRIPWEYVKKVEPGRIIVAPDPPRRKPSGSRSRQRTRPATARQSRR